ncbi:polyprenyl synthetase family protein [Agrococcus sp. SL85]|uniref:polyprenyl synthetase family protein n=1 Tax=Agrococcus sp. SL85 TaxID=2995141 RepID=UPI00226D23A0|nr:polyprenyl synthetase family protein [Agrococcus sp. SL85]WAC67108.1 polyprenyl synthetase family protein [Agrococcus sp. SL85]
MTAVDAPTTLAEVESRIRAIVAPTGPHPVQSEAERAAVGGKLLRPRLVIAAAGEGADHDAVVAVGAALELLHVALLVHDDVIDGDDERRGVPSIAGAAVRAAHEAGLGAEHAARLGLTTAVVSGDVLLARALAELVRLDLPLGARRAIADVVERSLVRAAEGEHDDVMLAGGEADEQAILRVLERKTADYSFRAPLELGAILGGRPAAAVAALGEIGMRMGVVYQLRDDVLGVFGDEAITGKSALSDIRAGAPTMLALLARRDAAWATIERHYGDPAADEGAAARVRAVVRGSGALDELERRIADGADEVRALIDAAPVEEALRCALTGILERCVERAR